MRIAGVLCSGSLRRYQVRDKILFDLTFYSDKKFQKMEDYRWK